MGGQGIVTQGWGQGERGGANTGTDRDRGGDIEALGRADADTVTGALGDMMTVRR